MKLLTASLICVMLILTSGTARSQEHSAEEICKIIYIIEGEEKANQPYGINPKYVKCNSKEECKQICLNTVENNRKRYADYGHEKYKTYLEFLQSKYCPLPERGCENWLPNLMYYLEKGE